MQYLDRPSPGRDESRLGAGQGALRLWTSRLAVMAKGERAAEGEGEEDESPSRLLGFACSAVRLRVKGVDKGKELGIWKDRSFRSWPI